MEETPPKSKMAGHTAFFYGTLMAPEILYRVCYGTSFISSYPTIQKLALGLTIQPAILHDYCRHKVQYADYPAIIPQTGRAVRGTYVAGLTDRDIERLDLFEGSEYERTDLKVEVLGEGKGKEKEKGEFKEAQSYVWCAGEDRLEEEEWDYDDFRKNKLHRWADTSEEFDDLDDDVVAEGHDPTGGRGFVVELDDDDDDVEKELHAAA